MIRFASIAALCVAVPVVAQQSPFTAVKSTTGKTYVHPHSKLGFPAELEGLPRGEMRQLGDQELDVSTQYGRTGEILSVYVYRNVAGSAPVWFDRARHAIEHRPEVYGSPALTVPVTAFAPPGQTSASGLMGGWNPTGGSFKGTVLALFPVDGWWVKVRYSSETRDARDLAARLPALLNQLTWPKRIAAQPAATEVTACPDRMETDANAKPVSDKDALTQGIIAAALMQTPTGKPSSATFCRDAATVPVGAVYRANGDTAGYIIALGDSGRALSVYPNSLTAILSGSNTPMTYSVNLVELGTVKTFAPLDRLPSPGRAISLLQNQPIATTVSTWGKKRTINVNGALLPK